MVQLRVSVLGPRGIESESTVGHDRREASGGKIIKGMVEREGR
jgi:hypothetical protein